MRRRAINTGGEPTWVTPTWSWGLYFVHDRGGYALSRWVVTHAPTGYIVQSFGSEADALALMLALVTDPDAAVAGRDATFAVRSGAGSEDPRFEPIRRVREDHRARMADLAARDRALGDWAPVLACGPWRAHPRDGGGFAIRAEVRHAGPVILAHAASLHDAWSWLWALHTAGGADTSSFIVWLHATRWSIAAPPPAPEPAPAAAPAPAPTPEPDEDEDEDEDEDRPTCDRCGDHYDEGTGYDGACPDCDDRPSCDRCGDRHADYAGHIVTLRGGAEEQWCEHCVDRHACETRCGRRMPCGHAHDLRGTPYWGCGDADCEDCYPVEDEDEDEDGLIRDYSDRTANRLGPYGRGRLFGVEAELRCGDECAVARAVRDADPHERRVVCKHDSTVDLELVSAPGDLAWHRETWPSIADAARRAGGRAWGEDGVGIHVHVDRRDLTPLAIRRLRRLIADPAHAAVIDVVAGRGDDRWCKRYLTNNDDRYVAVNECPERTVEIRIFQGNLRPGGIVRCVEAVDSMLSYLEASGGTGASIDAWLAYVARYRAAWPELAALLAGRGWVEPRPVAVQVRDRPVPVPPRDVLRVTGALRRDHRRYAHYRGSAPRALP